MTGATGLLDFDDYHDNELPRLLASGRAQLAAREVQRRGSLALRLEGGSAFTYRPGGAGVEIVRGDDGAETVVALDRDSWEGLVRDVETIPGLLYTGRAHRVRGDLMRFVGWEPALRALYQGIPVFDPAVPVLDEDGIPVDAGRTFHLDDDPREMTKFLWAAGYVVVKNVFSPSEVDAFLEEIGEVARRAVEGDGKSWWGRNSKGELLLSRVTHAGITPRLRGLATDPRILRVGSIPKLDLEPPRVEDDGAGVSVLWKWPDAVDGITNLPWHRDCGMGGHAVDCPSFICQVYYTPVTRGTGELRVLPGSHRGSYVFAEAEEDVPYGVAAPVGPGDVSLHFGDVMHGTPPPTGRQGPYRVSSLLHFRKPGMRHYVGEAKVYETLRGGGDGQVESMRKVAAEG